MSTENKPKEGLKVAELVELAYDISKQEFKDKPFSFINIGSKVWKTAPNFEKEKVESGIGNFYSALSTDPRFVIFRFNTGKLKEFMTASELKKLEKTIFSDDSVFEEEYEAFLKSSKEKKEVELLPDATSPEGAETELSEDSGDFVVDKEEIFEEEE